ncbi:hypothetical protein DL98DRAFT_638707 [Cadophora sp. DSE1049]|nr:hypothetical protein DL98DRAFT_638707 [Cadophora sp. DSE1049]
MPQYDSMSAWPYCQLSIVFHVSTSDNWNDPIEFVRLPGILSGLREIVRKLQLPEEIRPRDMVHTLLGLCHFPSQPRILDQHRELRGYDPSKLIVDVYASVVKSVNTGARCTLHYAAVTPAVTLGAPAPVDVREGTTVRCHRSSHRSVLAHYTKPIGGSDFAVEQM